MRRCARLALTVLLAVAAQAQQRPLTAGAAEVRAELDKLRTVGSVLMIAAHPDDENTALLAWLAQGRHLRTGYLALTRGEGGQNLIGSEQSELLGVIRTQELLAARRIDGAEQFFTRAIDFGFSKTADETMKKWGREEVLGDIVWVIRRFQPDVIVLRFSGTPRDGHGHHQTSAILGKEAFDAAADPKRFPEQLTDVQPWKAKRVLWNVFNFNPEGEKEAPVPGSITVDVGEYDPLRGYSYSEIAGISRGQHRSQGMGSPESKGSQKNELAPVAGEPMAGDLMDGVDTTWSRMSGGAEVGDALNQAIEAFDIAHPHQAVPALLRARQVAASLPDPWAQRKLPEFDELAARAAGLWFDAATTRASVTPGEDLKVRLTAVRRSPVDVQLSRVEISGVASSPWEPNQTLPPNDPATQEISVSIPAGAPLTQPYWLRRNPDDVLYSIEGRDLLGLAEAPPDLSARFHFSIGGVALSVERPVIHRWIDPVRGELTRPAVIAPPITVEFAERSLLFPESAPRTVELTVRANVNDARGEIAIQAPAGWLVEPSTLSYALTRARDQTLLSVEVTPPRGSSAGRLSARDRVSARVIDYEHFPAQTVFRPAELELVRADVRTLSRNIGYVMGAGDDVPQALRQWGVTVSLLSPDDLARGDLSRFDAIVTGVRAYNVRDDLRANQQRLLRFAENGGTLVVQYNVASRGRFGREPSDDLDHIGPYPIKIDRDRVTEEETPLTPVNEDHPLLQAPNRITPADYEGWVQERGLYFAKEWDERYQPIWESHDAGEEPLRGGTLYTQYGKGAYIFTPLSWFRELPAGVPGAHRIFANIVSAGKAVQ
jgi:LmbE family N-acetylglucosaminyl deacetylase